MKTAPSTSSPPVIAIYYFFLTFFLFYCDVSFSIASLSILGKYTDHIKSNSSLSITVNTMGILFSPHFLAALY